MSYPLLLCCLSILSCICIDESNSNKILALPLAVQNHVTEMDAIGRELIKRGHEVFFFLPEGFDINQLGPNTRVIRYGHNMVEKMDSFFGRANKEDNKRSTLTKMSDLRQIICSQIDKDVNSIKKLRQERFDFALVDFVFFLKCFYLVPYNLSIPFASIGNHISRLEIGHPMTTGFTPYSSSPFNLEMTFPQRFTHFFYDLFAGLLVNYFIPRNDVSSIAPGLYCGGEEDLPKFSDIFIESSDSVLDFPEPVMPNFFRVGCLMVEKVNSIPTTINNFFDDAKNGVIVMSFGSKFKTDSLIHSLFMSVFQKLEQRIFWKCDGEKQYQNILMYSRLSVNDALAHPNTKLLIFHCSRKGLFESVYGGVPLLCVPHSDDQFSNAKKVIQFQIGRFLQISQLNEKEIQNAINQILEDPKYSVNVKILSKILRSRPETPAQQAATAIEYVIKFGGIHLRSRQIEQSPFQLLQGDIWFAVFLVLILTFILIFFIVGKCCIVVSRLRNKVKVH